MNGLLEAIDPYASYLNADQYKDYLKNYDTYRGDLGMVLAKKYGYVTVVSVVPGFAGRETGSDDGRHAGIDQRHGDARYAACVREASPEGPAGNDGGSLGAAAQTGAAEADDDA